MAAASASVAEDRKLLSSPNLTPTASTVEHANKKSPGDAGALVGLEIPSYISSGRRLGRRTCS
jgi:hypothetical protein